ncbi:hypothetical protein [Vibrio sonorensis]|uniref:hypothetical protein n=1 Tax=Vibrio sonorensis TaxID=1004316 RepID=UPI0008D9DCBE|nr:hypothetical protein [Vibrio sonorensis]
MKRVFIACFAAAFALLGCQSTNTQTAEPYVERYDIQQAQAAFADVEHVTVSDEGYIEYIEQVPNGYQWKTTVIRSHSRQVACEDLYELLELGFVIKMTFTGKGGRTEHFDVHRCDGINAEKS